MWVSKRNSKILTRLIEIYTERFQPVSSDELAKCLGFSASAIRKDLQDLERMGFLTKLNASSGRIPSNQALRAYIRGLSPQADDLSDDDFAQMPMDAEFSYFSQQMLIALSQQTNSIGFVLFDSIFELSFRRIQIVKMGVNRVMMLLHASSGMSFTKVFTTHINYSDQSLQNWSKLLSEEFKGKNLNQAMRSIRNRIARDQERYLQIYRELYFFLGHNDLKATEFLYEGESRFWHPNLNNPQELREVLSALKEKSLLASFLLEMRSQTKTEPLVAFGDETGIKGLDNYMLIFSHLFSSSRAVGDVGIIGPRFMSYAISVSQVNRFSCFFSRKLTGLSGRS